MPSERKRLKKQEETYAEIAIRVKEYEVAIESDINNNVYAPQYAWRSDDRDPLYRFVSRLKIAGVATHPAERAGDAYELTIYGDDAPSQRINTTLKDVQLLDKYGSPKYRLYRGREIPIYDPPKGLGLLEKARGETLWTGWIHAPTRFVSDLISLLGHGRPLFVSLRECKSERARWIRDMSLQTIDPSQE